MKLSPRNQLISYLHSFIIATDDNTLLNIGRDILGEDDEDVLEFASELAMKDFNED